LDIRYAGNVKWARRPAHATVGGGWLVRIWIAAVCALIVVTMGLAAPVAWAQPQVPATFFGSVTVDGKPPPEGTEVRGLIDGQDCTQLGPGYRGTITDGGVGAYVINVMHESQKAGCGKDGKAITFTIGGRPAVQTATWKLGPQELNLSIGAGTPPPLPTATPTRTTGPAQAAATATEVARFTPRASGVPPTDDVQLPLAQATATRTPPAVADDSGGFPVLLVLLVVVVVLAATGAAAGFILARRTSSPGGGGDAT
jgi:hypothetical protein